MILITERPSLNKIKMFFCNGDCPSFIANLKINRGIPENDLNVYKVTDGTKFICDAYNYVIDQNTLTICEKVQITVSKSKFLDWAYMSDQERLDLYDVDTLNKIDSLISRYTIDLIKSFYSGKVPFPSDYSFFDGIYVDIPPKAVPYTSYEYHEVPKQVIEVEAI